MTTLEVSIDRLVLKGKITKVKSDEIKAGKKFKDYKGKVKK